MADNETIIGILIQARAQIDAAVSQVQAGLGKVMASANSATAATVSATAASNKASEALTGLGRAASTIPGPMGQAAVQVEALAAASASSVAVASALAAGLVAAGTAAVLAARGLGDYNERMRNLSLQTGFTREQLGGLKLITADVGGTLEQVTMGARFLNDALNDANQGNEEAIKKFDALKISYKDGEGKMRAVGDVFEDLGKKIRDTQDPTERIGIATSLLGQRTGAQLIPTLLKAADAFKTYQERAKELGITLSPEAVLAAERADSAFKNLSFRVEGLRNEFGLLSTGIIPAIEQLNKFIETARKGLQTPFGQQFAAQLLGGIPVLNPKQPVTGTAPSAATSALVDQIMALTQSGSHMAPHTGGIAAEAVSDEEKKRLEALQDQITAMKEQLALNPSLLAELEKALRTAKEHARTIAEQNLLYQAQRDLIRMVPGQPGVATAGTEQLGPVAPKTAHQMAVEEAYRGLDLMPKAGGTADISVMTEEWDRALQRVGLTIDDVTAAANATTPSLEKLALKMIEQKELTLQLVATMASGITSGVRNIVSAFFEGTQSVGQAFASMIQGMMEDVVSAVASKAILGLIGLQSGGTLAYAQAGGVVGPAIAAQSGLIVSGIRGVDTVPIMAGRGETILSHDLTDKLGRFLAWAEARVTTPEPPAAAPVTNNITLAPQFHSVVADKQTLRNFVQEDLAPMLDDVIPRGSYRRQ